MSGGRYVLALDQGTTSSRAIVFDGSGAICGQQGRELRQIYPRPGWVEHDPNEILKGVMFSAEGAIARAGITPDDIAAIGITCQRETTILWDRETGEPIYNAIVWQCRRTAADAEKLKNDGLEPFIFEKTGLIPDAYFSATKIKWILDNVPNAREKAEAGKLCFGTVDSFLLWHLSGGKVHATDYTNASRTMLFNIREKKWDDELLKLMDIPAAILPEVHPSSHRYCMTDCLGGGTAIPVSGIAGDQQAALFGHLCLNVGEAKNTYGTGCFLLMNTGGEFHKSSRGLITTLAASGGDKPHYALEGSVFVGGAVVQWLRDEMKMVATAAETESLALSVPDTGGVYLVPAFTGLGAPHWDALARGTITGITRGTKREHIVRAALESIAYQVFDVIHAMERDTGLSLKSLRVDGGASANAFLMQFQSDITDAKVMRPAVTETTALGAAYLAGLCEGFWESEKSLQKQMRYDAVFTPKMSESHRQKFLVGWAESIGKAKYRF